MKKSRRFLGTNTLADIHIERAGLKEGWFDKAEIDVFPELSYFFHDSADVGNLISGSSAFSKTSEHQEVHGSCLAEA